MNYKETARSLEFLHLDIKIDLDILISFLSYLFLHLP